MTSRKGNRNRNKDNSDDTHDNGDNEDSQIRFQADSLKDEKGHGNNNSIPTSSNTPTCNPSSECSIPKTPKEEWQTVWNEFDKAIRDINAPFDQFFWMKKLLFALLALLLHATNLHSFIPGIMTFGKSMIPCLAIGVVVVLVGTYFWILQDYIVVTRWCAHGIHYVDNSSSANGGGNADDTQVRCGDDETKMCHWVVVHGLFVCYLAIMIISNYLRTTFTSPGVVLPTENAKNISHACPDNQDATPINPQQDGDMDNLLQLNQNEWNTIESQGGCCFFKPTLNVEEERRRVALYCYPSNTHNGTTHSLDIGKANSTNLDASPINVGDKSKPEEDVAYLPSPDVTFCKKCKMNRPPRSHHCSKCNRCILQMDHHCIWMNNCIGYNNYRSFLLTITFLVIGCWYGAALTGVCFTQIMVTQFREHGFKMYYEHKTGILDLPPPLVLWSQFWSDEIDPKDVVKIAFPFFLGVGVILTFFLSSHLQYVMDSVTTLENMAYMTIKKRLEWKKREVRKSSFISKCPDDCDDDSLSKYDMKFVNPFHEGTRRNFYRILGPIHFCFLPISVQIPPPYIPIYNESKNK